VTAAIRIFCTTNPSFVTSVVNGILAWATVLGGCTACGSGLPAGMLLLTVVRPDVRADLINIGMGVGFLVGMAGGSLMCFVFIARLAT
jgi:hypothetical protein